MRVAIVGSRNFPDLDRVGRFVTALAAKYPEALVVSGGARGVDRAAETAAEARGLLVVSFRPYENRHPDNIGTFSIVRHTDFGREFLEGNYPSYGRAAFARNRMIVEGADQVVAFSTGSIGTAHSIGLAEELSIPTHIYTAEV